jgi:hypothetical protein
MYTPERLSKIVAQFYDGPFSLGDRIGIVNDVWALCQSGHATTSSALALFDGMRAETECTPTKNFLHISD